MTRRILRCATLSALVTALLAASAFAHDGNADYESLVRGVVPQIPGFTVEVLNGDDRLLVRNVGAMTVTIEGYNGEPYLRLRPGGIVEANLRSPAHYLNQDRFTGAEVPASADPKAPAQWELVERGGRYEFHDHRMHWMAKSVPQQVSDRSRRTKVFDWSVPVRAEGTSGRIAGELFWRGSGPGAPVGAFVGLGALLLLGGGTVVVVRRRRAAGAATASGPPGREAW